MLFNQSTLKALIYTNSLHMKNEPLIRCCTLSRPPRATIDTVLKNNTVALHVYILRKILVLVWPFLILIRLKIMFCLVLLVISSIIAIVLSYLKQYLPLNTLWLLKNRPSFKYVISPTCQMASQMCSEACHFCLPILDGW